MRKLALAAVLVLAISGLGWARFGQSPDLRVLFVGNSFTFGNDLPALTADLADANGVDVDVEMIAHPGYFLSQHVTDSDVLAAISSGDYDVVVLQEQSVAPAEPNRFANDTLPAIRQFSAVTGRSDVRVVLFQTWGHQSGNPISGHTSYEGMQEALINSYATMALEIDGEVAPVGSMWWRARTSLPTVQLYAPDGYHPSLEGSYLAAAVLASTITGVPIEEPAGGHINDETARQITDLVP